MKKFRSQLVYEFIISHYIPGKVADIGGGKGLLSYLLNQSGWDSTVIDPVYQPLPTKYTNLDKKKIKIDGDATVPHITSPFEKEMGKDFDLLIGLHSHGSNLRIVDAAAEYHKEFILLPCCIINEGIDPYSVTDWLEYIEEYANKKGIMTQREKLNFKGQRTAIYSIS